MNVTPFASAKPYDAPLHAGVLSLRLQGMEASPSAFCSVGLSYYLPGGNARMSAGPTDKIYVVIDGELSVETGDGQQVTLGKFDSCFIPAGETREAVNKANAMVTLLVVIATPSS